MANLSISIDQLIEQTVAQKVQEQLNTLSPTVSHQLINNKAHYYASRYYEAMLRYWSNSQLIYMLSTQVNVVSHAIALEINRATVEFTKANNDAYNAWIEFVKSLDDRIGFDDDMLADAYDLDYYAITYVFPDGLTISAALKTNYQIKFGGLPVGTCVYINGKVFEIVADGFYMVDPMIYESQRITALINY